MIGYSKKKGLVSLILSFCRSPIRSFIFSGQGRSETGCGEGLRDWVHSVWVQDHLVRCREMSFLWSGLLVQLCSERLWHCRRLSFSSECPRSWLMATWGPLAPRLFALLFISWACLGCDSQADTGPVLEGLLVATSLNWNAAHKVSPARGPGLAVWGFLNALNITKIEFHTERLKRKEGARAGMEDYRWGLGEWFVQPMNFFRMRENLAEGGQWWNVSSFPSFCPFERAES